MKLAILGLAIVSVAFVPQVICQTEQRESLHFSTGTERANINFTADSIERQDPTPTAATPYASVIRLKGNVVIRTCCVQKGIGLGKRPKNQPKQVMIMHADEADYRQDTGEIEARGKVLVTFQNYPK
jgi:hypothetical protein